MTLSDRLIHSLTWRLCRTDAGIAIYRVIRWGLPRILPYEPKPGLLSELATKPRFPVEIKASTIVGAGQGLFALVDIPAGEVVGEYSGDRIPSLAKWMRLRNKDYVMMTDSLGLVVDAAKRQEMILRYVNHHFDPRRQNLIREAKNESVYFVTTRPIAAGEEFFVDYGDLYWKLRGVKPDAARKAFDDPSNPTKV